MPGERVQVRTLPDGRVDVSVRTDDGAWVRLHSARAPEAEARQWVDRALAGQPVPSLVGIIGPGLGFVIDELIARRADVRIVALEILPELVTLWQQRTQSLTLLPGQIVIGTAPAFEMQVVRWPAEALAAEPLLLVHPVVQQHWAATVDTARRALAQYVFEQRSNEDARQRLAPLYLAQTLQNLPGIATSPDVSVLDGIASGEPLVICGAGPSLDRLLPVLRANRHRAWYVALDTSIRPLLAAGIVPDLVIAIDPTGLNGRHLLNLPTRQRPWMVCEGSVEPPVWSAFRGRTLMGRVNRSDPWPWLESLGVAPTVLRAWGSVLTTACDVVTRMRPSSVAFAAVDLAYTFGQPYCRGTACEAEWEAERVAGNLSTIEEVWAARLKDRTVAEPDVHGRPTQTAGHLVAFRNWVRRLVVETPACRFANVTGEGIVHGEGIAQTDLESWLRDEPSPAGDLEERISARVATSSPVDQNELASAIELAVASDSEPWTGWEDRVPRVDRAQLRRLLTHAARQVRAFKDAKDMTATHSDWIDVPFDAADFAGHPPLQWVVDEKNIVTYAYRIEGKTMMLSFKVSCSTLTGYPSNELYLKIPGGHRAARGTANTIWISSHSGKETGYATTHPGLDLIVLFRATEDNFPIVNEWFFVFGQMTLEIQ